MRAEIAELRTMRRALRLLPACLALAGCALNQLRVEDTRAVVESSAAAGAGAQAFLAEVDRARTRTTIALAVADPACGRLRPEVRQSPDLRPDAPVAGALCVEAPAPDSPRLLSTDPLGPELAPTLQLVDALGAYAGGLAAAAADRGGAPPAQVFADALALARMAQSTLGVGGTALPSAGDPRVKAALDLVTFLDGLAREAATVRRLRAFLAAHPDAMASILNPLERQLGSWERARAGDAGLRLVAAGWAAQRVLALRPAGPAAERQAALEAFYGTRDALAAEARLAPALFQALAAVRQSDADLRRVLLPDAPLTPAERRRVQAEARARLVTAFTRIAALAASIRSA